MKTLLSLWNRFIGPANRPTIKNGIAYCAKCHMPKEFNHDRCASPFHVI